MTSTPRHAKTTDLPNKYPINEESEAQYNIFAGVAKVRLSHSIQQGLSLSFELQISPPHLVKLTACRIALNKVVFAASRMKNLNGNDGFTLDHYYVTKEAWIIVTPRAVNPHLEFTTASPPTHKVTYNILRNAQTPEAIKVKGKVIYERKSLLQKSQFAKSAKSWLLKSVQLKHWVMELEAHNRDRYRFFEVSYPRQGQIVLTMEVDASQKPVEWNLTRVTIEGLAAAKPNNPDRAR